MKKLLILMMVAVGCFKTEREKVEELLEVNTALPLSFEEQKIVGTYGSARGDNRIEFFENRKWKAYASHWPPCMREGTWKMVGKEVYKINTKMEINAGVYKIEPNGDLTKVALFRKGREGRTKYNGRTYPKLK